MIASIHSNPNTGATPPSPERQAFGELAKSLRNGDLDAARQAFANVIRNAPEGASWPKGSPFADLGKALVRGDVDAARTAFASMVKGRAGVSLPVEGGEPAAPGPVTVPSSTGGESGSVLNVVA
jgi:TolA-binding protein